LQRPFPMWLEVSCLANHIAGGTGAAWIWQDRVKVSSKSLTSSKLHRNTLLGHDAEATQEHRDRANADYSRLKTVPISGICRSRRATTYPGTGGEGTQSDRLNLKLFEPTGIKLSQFARH
jgi:hypothetical protein